MWQSYTNFYWNFGLTIYFIIGTTFWRTHTIYGSFLLESYGMRTKNQLSNKNFRTNRKLSKTFCEINKHKEKQYILFLGYFYILKPYKIRLYLVWLGLSGGVEMGAQRLFRNFSKLKKNNNNKFILVTRIHWK